MKYEVGLRSDIGRRRKNNQDNGIAIPERGLFIVADGMGGHQGGEIASQMVVEIVPKLVEGAQSKSDWDPRKTLESSLTRANDEIYQRADRESNLRGMGTTTTALLFTNQTLSIGQVGDSRCYFIQPDAIWQLTRDHSLVEEKRRAGLITRDQLKTDQFKNVITRSVGFEPLLMVDVYEREIKPGDIYLVCSDGLSGMLGDHEILEIVQKNLIEENQIEATLNALIQRANDAGGDDNVTVLVVRVLES